MGTSVLYDFGGMSCRTCKAAMKKVSRLSRFLMAISETSLSAWRTREWPSSSLFGLFDEKAAEPALECKQKSYSARKRGRIAFAANWRIIEILDFAIQVKLLMPISWSGLNMPVIRQNLLTRAAFMNFLCVEKGERRAGLRLSSSTIENWSESDWLWEQGFKTVQTLADRSVFCVLRGISRKAEGRNVWRVFVISEIQQNISCISRWRRLCQSKFDSSARDAHFTRKPTIRQE